MQDTSDQSTIIIATSHRPLAALPHKVQAFFSAAAASPWSSAEAQPLPSIHHSLITVHPPGAAARQAATCRSSHLLAGSIALEGELHAVAHHVSGSMQMLLCHHPWYGLVPMGACVKVVDVMPVVKCHVPAS